MALTPLRKKLNIAVGLLFLGAIGFVLWPLLTRPLHLMSFCGDLRPGMADAEIRRLASEQGFHVSPLADAGAHVYDLQSLGRFNCALRIQAGALTSASFALSD